LGKYLKNTEVSQILGYFFPRVSLGNNVLQKMCLATFWVIFSQTHLVTLRSEIHPMMVVPLALSACKTLPWLSGMVVL
jgi:hypothetical protein